MQPALAVSCASGLYAGKTDRRRRNQKKSGRLAKPPPPAFLQPFPQDVQLKFNFEPQTPGHALAHAGVSLHPQIKAQGQGLRGRDDKAEFAYAGAAFQVRGVDGVAVGRGSGFAVEFIFPGRAGVRGNSFTS